MPGPEETFASKYNSGFPDGLHRLGSRGRLGSGTGNRTRVPRLRIWCPNP